MLKMKYCNLLLIIFIVILMQNGKIEALQKVTMDDSRRIINVYDPNKGFLSSGILKSHSGISYTTGAKKTLIFSAPPGYGILASIRLQDFRPNSEDVLTLYAYNYSMLPAVFKNNYFFRNKIFDSSESTTYYVPNGQLGVTFQTNYGSSYGYGGFELTFTAQSNMAICNYGNFRCWNGRCIADILRCDGHNHCGDRSDQLACSHDHPKGGRITGIVFGVVFLLIAVSCAIFIIVRRATRTRTEGQTIINQPVTTHPPGPGYPPAYLQPGAYYPPPPPPYSQGTNNPGYH